MCPFSGTNEFSQPCFSFGVVLGKETTTKIYVDRQLTQRGTFSRLDLNHIIKD